MALSKSNVAHFKFNIAHLESDFALFFNLILTLLKSECALLEKNFTPNFQSHVTYNIHRF